MPKIVSRLSELDTQLERMRASIASATCGAIAENGDISPGKDLEELVVQMETSFEALLAAATHFEGLANAALMDKALLEMHVSHQDEQWAPFIEAIDSGVQYDEDLDHATMDTMESLIASGMADSTDLCGVEFDPNITVTREDFKPIVRQAVESWLRLKSR